MDHERLTRVGHFFLAGDNATNDRHGVLVAILGPDESGKLPTPERIAALLASRLHLVPRRFRRVLLPAPFSIAAPLLVDDLEGGLPRLQVLGPEGMGRDAFRRALMGFACHPVDFRRPLWEIALAPRLEDGTAALVVKLHHAIVEGEGAGAILAALFFARAPSEAIGEPTPWTPAPPPGIGRQLRLAALDQARRLADTAARTARVGWAWRQPKAQWRKLMKMRLAYRTQLNRRRPESMFSRPVGSAFDHQVAVGDSRTVLDICERCGDAASFDDVVLAAIAGGLRRWLAAIGEPLSEIVIQLAISVGSRGLGPSRDFTDMPSLMVVELPIDEPDPANRLRRVCATTTQRRPQLRALQTIQAPLAHLPMPLYRRTAGWLCEQGFDFHIASLRGPPVQPYVLANPVELAYIMAPVRGRYPLRMTVLSFGGKLTISFGCDPDIIREPEMLARAIEAALDELSHAV